MITLGKKAKDKITGFEGIITGRAQYLYGCDQYCIAPPARDGEIKHSEWFDEGRILVVGDGVKPEDVGVEKSGGPNRDCPR
ncbi:hypothetical protein HNQ80_004155 [Anaerosolibacter carboniphilus]|uniref:Uncharacterized protein n=1 Tax=Anaerosolibacter carboniphilus TaxID=1417629 RepID=A0A841L0B9_9FIRM|nr:hypothetical protein [Anaerosolibacter carboniphilus]MBB6218018.1 hypothetical protein [Anaerosolibacter carboniphilus]